MVAKKVLRLAWYYPPDDKVQRFLLEHVAAQQLGIMLGEDWDVLVEFSYGYEIQKNTDVLVVFMHGRFEIDDPQLRAIFDGTKTLAANTAAQGIPVVALYACMRTRLLPEFQVEEAYDHLIAEDPNKWPGQLAKIVERIMAGKI